MKYPFRPSAFKLSTFRLFIPFFVQFGSGKFRRKVMDNMPSKLLQRVKDIVDVMDETSSEIYQQKKMAFAKGDAAVLQQVGYGRDIMSILRKSLLLLYKRNIHRPSILFSESQSWGI